MSEKQEEREVISDLTEEKNEQEGINKHKRKKVKIIKNEKLRKVVFGLVFIVIGIIVGREAIANRYNLLVDEYNALEQQIGEQESQIAELQSKVDEAQPWFKMKDEEKRKVEEENARIIAEKNAEAEKKAEEERLAKEEQEKNKYNTELTYNEIARNPEQTLFKNCKFTGKVVQVIEGDGTNNLRVAINGDYDKMMLVEYKPSILKSRILEKDNVTLYGTSAGTTSYTSTMGSKITIPAMVADKIDIN